VLLGVSVGAVSLEPLPVLVQPAVSTTTNNAVTLSARWLLVMHL